MNRIQEGQLTAVFRLQAVFVGLPRPDYCNFTPRGKGKETPLRRSARCFDVSPHRCLLQSHICCKNCYRCRYVMKRLLELDIKLKDYEHQIYSADTPQASTEPAVVCLYRSFMRKTRFGRWIDPSSRGFVKSVPCLFLSVRHKGFVKPGFTNNTDMAKGSTVCALVTNVMDSW